MIIEMETKEALWNECLLQNVFVGYTEAELPNVQTAFEEVYAAHTRATKSEFVELLSQKLKIKSTNQFVYKDLFPPQQPPKIDFSDKDEEPLKDLDRLIADKKNERDQWMTTTPAEEHYKYQNKILEQILESQIKILKALQKK
jgi:hypothetical protein